MAIFASTTTSGYSDPLKAYSIKALEQRMKDQQAQMAAQQPDAAMMATIPGGIGHVLSQVGDRMQQGRNEQALAAQKQELAQRMSGYDPTGDAPPPAAIAPIAPEIYKDMMQTWAQNRLAKQAQAASAAEHALTREHSSKESGLTREQQSKEGGLTRQQQLELASQTDARARELAGVSDQRARDLAAEQDKRARELQADRLKAEADLEQKKLDAAKATAAADPKRAEAVENSETNYRKGLSHIDNLEEAAKILDHPGGIYTGALQSAAPVIGGVPGVGGMLVDKEKAQRTSRFNTIVGEDAIRDMSSTLKGSSTNFELQKFEKMKNDPNISDADRATQLRRAQAAARADLEAQAKTAKAIGGDTERIDRAMRDSKVAPTTTGMKEEDIAASLANAQAAVASGKWTKEQANAKLKAAGVPRGL